MHIHFYLAIQRKVLGMRRRPYLVATVAYWTKDEELLRVGGYGTLSIQWSHSVRCLITELLDYFKRSLNNVAAWLQCALAQLPIRHVTSIR
jgi:hypothetical protein